MKTKISPMAITFLAVVTLAPAAFAGPGLQYWQNLGHQRSTSAVTEQVMNDRCKADSCCAKKTVADTTGGGRSAQLASKSIVTCKKTCTIEIKAQSSTCHNGMRA